MNTNARSPHSERTKSVLTLRWSPLCLLVLGLLSFSCQKKEADLEPSYREEVLEETPKPLETEEEGNPALSEKQAHTTLGVPLPPQPPSAQMESLVELMKKGNYERFLKRLGSDVLGPEKAEYLRPFFEGSDADYTLREVGELEINARTRWALQSSATGQELFFDFRKLSEGNWAIDAVHLPSLSTAGLSPGLQGDSPKDSLARCDEFVSALVSQDFEKALRYLDKDTISNTMIAALCIIFEEGKYALREKKPVRSLFQRERAAAFMANVIDASGDQSGQFSITLQRESQEEDWTVTEINLDKLIARYVEQVSGGDSYYTPLVQNLEGGNTLALYFEFNENALTARSKRQLEIVANVLKADEGKKLTLSGHTDSLGSNSYNQTLSQERAEAVKRFLVSQQIEAEQIRILAFGESQPRRGNDTDQGRRVNRRAEIYLDF